MHSKKPSDYKLMCQIQSKNRTIKIHAQNGTCSNGVDECLYSFVFFFTSFVVASNKKEIGVKCENDLCTYSNGRIYLGAIVMPIWMR